MIFHLVVKATDYIGFVQVTKRTYISEFQLHSYIPLLVTAIKPEY